MQQKKISINFSKANINICLRLHYNDDRSYLYVNKTEISLNCTIYDFSVEHSSIKKDDILNIPQYLMIKNNIKQCAGLLKKYFSDY